MLARSKSMRGLGFWELEIFKEALLTKMVKRILNESLGMNPQEIILHQH